MLLFGGVLTFFLAAELATRIGVHRGVDPLAGEIDIFLVSNGVHVDVWVPAHHDVRDWTTWLPTEVPLEGYGYVAFGWGERHFYMDVPTWDDLTLAIAARAVLIPSGTAMHVTAYSGRPIEHDQVHLLRVDRAHYEALVGFIDSGFALDGDGRPVLVDHPGYENNDRFFEGRGAYHAFRTCNTWTNNAVRAMGKPASRWAPLEHHVRFHLPRNRGVGSR